jgi:hypothetical protein
MNKKANSHADFSTGGPLLKVSVKDQAIEDRVIQGLPLDGFARWLENDPRGNVKDTIKYRGRLATIWISVGN